MFCNTYDGMASFSYHNTRGVTENIEDSLSANIESLAKPNANWSARPSGDEMG
jgi:hypothetical protein